MNGSVREAIISITLSFYSSLLIAPLQLSLSYTNPAIASTYLTYCSVHTLLIPYFVPNDVKWRINMKLISNNATPTDEERKKFSCT
jgi:hypothetical protein